LSVEKLPQAIMLVLTMFFGKLDPEVIDVLTRSASAYRNAIDKSSSFVTNKLKVELVKRTVQTCSLLFDDSEKFGRAATIVMLICCMEDKTTQSRVAGLLPAITKKGEDAATDLYDFLDGNFGAQVKLITAGTTDGFAAACISMSTLLAKIDSIPFPISTVPSIVAENGVEFRLDVPFRQHRTRTCMMHAWE
jgi:hypothetical protein